MSIAMQKHYNLKELQSEYDKIFDSEPIRDEERAYRWFAAKVQQEKPDVKHALDLACGGGYFLRFLRSALTKNDVSCAGIDLSHKALTIAMKECAGSQLVCAAAEALPFKEHTFDGITCLGSLEHFLDISDSIKEIKRVATSNARVFILVPNIFWYKDILQVLFRGERKERNQAHERFASLGEWKDTLESLGLKVLKTEKYNGIARNSIKQTIKDWLVPLRFSYHFLFVCSV